MSTNEPKRIHAEDGTDITEAVQILYDIAHGSMDWGSGFLDNEEVEAVVELALHMGWDPPELPDGSPIWVAFARRHPEAYEVTPRMRIYADNMGNPQESEWATIKPRKQKP